MTYEKAKAKKTTPGNLEKQYLQIAANRQCQTVSADCRKQAVPLFAHPVYVFGTIEIVDPPMLKAAPRTKQFIRVKQWDGEGSPRAQGAALRTRKGLVP